MGHTMAMLNNQRVSFLVHTSYGEKKVFHGIPHNVPWIPVPFQGHRFFLQVLILPVPLDPWENHHVSWENQYFSWVNHHVSWENHHVSWVYWENPSIFMGKSTVSWVYWENPSIFMGKSTISMVISYGM
jgi:hypothetical protein